MIVFVRYRGFHNRGETSADNIIAWLKSTEWYELMWMKSASVRNKVYKLKSLASMQKRIMATYNKAVLVDIVFKQPKPILAGL